MNAPMCDLALQPAIDPAAEHIARRQIWDRKYAIRACYAGWYARMKPFILSGPSVEIGAGSGQFRQFWPGLITTDVVRTPYVCMVADGMRLPVADTSLSNLLVIDLLHHLADPHVFFDEAARALRPGGRVLALEPYITPVSWLAYKTMHHEDVWFGGYHKAGPGKSPWDGNMAIPNLIFGRERRDWPRRHPTLRITHQRKFSFFDFQLAAGFKPYAYVGHPRWYDFFRGLDRLIEPLAFLCGFRIFCVIEKANTDATSEIE